MRTRFQIIFGVVIVLLNLVKPVGAQETFHRFIYDPATGNLALDNQGRQLIAVEILSQSAILTGTRPPFVQGLFDVFQPGKLFYLNPLGFDDLDFGPVMTPGLTEAILKSDLKISGGLYMGGSLGRIEIVANDFTPTILHYDSLTGAMSLEQPDDPTRITYLTSLVIDSKSRIFTGTRPATLTNQFDLFRPDRLFKMELGGFKNVDLGTPAATGLSVLDLTRDLCVSGSLLGGGRLSGVRLNSATGPFLAQCDTELPRGGDVPPLDEVLFGYNFYTGRMTLSVRGSPLTAMELITPDEFFTGDRPAALSGPSDIFDAQRIVKIDSNGFGETTIDFGMVLPAGLSEAQLKRIQVAGTRLSGEVLQDSTFYFYAIPEPSGMSLLVVAGVVGLRARRRCRTVDF